MIIDIKHNVPHIVNMKSPITAVDVIQKTWIPEGTREYEVFKHVTQENAQLVSEIKRHIEILPGDLILDVGGRDGNVAFDLQEPKWVDIVDPDPTIRLLKKPRKFWNEKVQNVEFSPEEKYKVIIACHVLGYLGLQEVQRDVIEKLLAQLVEGGTLVLFYNTNQGYMGDLLEYSRHIMPMGHYDYFNELLLDNNRNPRYDIKHLDTAFRLEYESFEDLARCTWFLFGAINSDIDACASNFLPKLKNDLLEPIFMIDERMVFITKKPEMISYPTIL
jgi:hypothetical protein